MHTQQRRSNEELYSLKNKILAMLEDCDDKMTKVQLLIQLEFITSLSNNTAGIIHIASSLESHVDNFNKHIIAFEEHTIKEDNIINQIKGAKPLMIWLGRVAYTIIGGMLLTTYLQLQDTATRVSVNENILATHNEKLKDLNK